MNINDFNYDLPEELIAQTPIKKRDESRLLVLNKNTKEIAHRHFYNILEYLNAGDCLVLNDTKVIPARLIGEKESTKAHIELLLLHEETNNEWECLARPAKRLKKDTIVSFGNGILKAQVLEVKTEGLVKIKLLYNRILMEILDQLGETPLPPYIHEKLKEKDRYQTVYAKCPGSAAAPTAGLHFTKELLEQAKEKGIKVIYLTLHIGLGTFRPVTEENILDHKMHSEYYILTKEAAKAINEAKTKGGKIISVGTTSTRVLETIADEKGNLKEASGYTDIFIYPGYKFKCIDGLITNLHLPKSTLVMLVSALAGRENILNAYKIAVEEKYRFFSFGDAMLIM